MNRRVGILAASLVALVTTATAQTISGTVVTEGSPSRYPRLNSDFAPRGQSLFDRDTVALSTSGYPIVQFSEDVPVCTSPFAVRDANDAWKAQDRNWLARINSCAVLTAGSRLEWLTATGVPSMRAYQFRATTPSGDRVNVYVPDDFFPRMQLHRINPASVQRQ